MFELVNKDVEFDEIDADGREALITGLINRVARNDFSMADSGVERWDKGWGENLEAFKASKNIIDLVPKYVLRKSPLRLNGTLIQPRTDQFELNWINDHQQFLFKQLRNYDAIYEFGCGSCYNLAVLKLMYPNKKLVGLDWSKMSIKICEQLDIEGRQFDFFYPDSDFEFAPNSAVLTWGALEQTGNKVGPFIRWLKSKKPAFIMHSEPIVEWYNESNLLDAVTILIHKHRGFMVGLPNLLRLMDVNIIKEHRTGFGSLLLEGYSQLWWKP